jgi:hypothetical protein
MAANLLRSAASRAMRVQSLQRYSNRGFLSPRQSIWRVRRLGLSTVQTSARNGNEKKQPEEGSIMGGVIMVGILLAANAIGLWCEFNMTPDQSLLQGLATLNRKPNTTTTTTPEKEEALPPRRRKTKILHFRLTSNK